MSILLKLYKILRPAKARGMASKLVKCMDAKVVQFTIKKLTEARVEVNKQTVESNLTKMKKVKDIFANCIDIIGERAIVYSSIKEEEFSFRTETSNTYIRYVKHGVGEIIDEELLNKGGKPTSVLIKKDSLDWVSGSASVKDVIDTSLFIITTAERFANTPSSANDVEGYLREKDRVSPILTYANSREFLILLNDLVNCMIIYLNASKE